jgi:hypothetical protein
VLDVVLAVAVVAVLLTLALAVLLAVTVAPLLVALARGEQVGASPVRVTAAAVVGSLVALGLAEAARRSGGPLAGAVPLLLAWAAPVAVARTPRGSRWLGGTGRHVRA